MKVKIKIMKMSPIYQETVLVGAMRAWNYKITKRKRKTKKEKNLKQKKTDERKKTDEQSVKREISPEVPAVYWGRIYGNVLRRE